MHPPLIQSLLQPGAYPHGVSRIELVETHISWVILTGDYAYKVKKPVNLGFLDFSTLAQRRRCCEEELRLNRRSAPDIYLAVVGIAAPGRVLTGEEAPIVEYAVRMHQFDPALRLDRYLTDHRLTPAHIDAFAAYLCAFHAAAAEAGTSDDFGDYAAVSGAALENFSQIAGLLTGAAAPPELAVLRSWTDATGQRLQTDFASRKQAGRVRECHGDMHLANMIMWQNRITLFDCIEFNAHLRWIDVISDIAFLIMDLEERGMVESAYRFLNAYLLRSGDYPGVKLLPYYLVYRAMVRAKVAMIQAGQQPPAAADYRRLYQQFLDYLHLASRQLRPTTPMLLLTVGYSGAGKTTIAEQLAWRLRALHLRSDAERKRLAGLELHADSGSRYGEGLYSRDRTAAVYRRLLSLGDDLLAWGQHVIIDATFLDPQRRQEFQRLAQRRQARFILLHVTTDTATLRARVEARLADRQRVSEAGPEVLEQQLRQPLHWLEEEAAWTKTIDGGGATDLGKLAEKLLAE